ncbi:MAG TPA: N,N-dimethylformamidase beta subunit family domain-containing protein [Vicinamibacterales bacterium]|nr:N,N-dimethylformamidase beta subunit family domain-containing protein [Vicinamibacterales bacterium]
MAGLQLYGGNSLYHGVAGTQASRAYKVSYNRPITTRGSESSNSLFNAEFPMVRWLEADGYDVSYITGVDSDRRGATLLNPSNHRVFMSVGHDEYWSGGQRTNVETARAAGMHLAFFTGNEIFWKTRWEPSIDGTATPYRTLVTYKETHANAVIDPADPSTWTGTWRDARFSPPADGGRPENALTGTAFMAQCCQLQFPSISVPPAMAALRFWRDTPIAASGGGTLGPRVSGDNVWAGGVLGYEFDEDLDNGFRPAGLIQLSSTSATIDEKLQDNGSLYLPGSVTHSLTLYRASSGALVFGAGTVQWSWGLDNVHDRLPDATSDYTNASIQQATVNLLADMGAQPASLRLDLTPAVSSPDVVAPTSTITSPANGTAWPAGSTLTVTGTASDVGGRVASVDVSFDHGATWHRATGRESWTIAATVPSSGALSIQSRAAPTRRRCTRSPTRRASTTACISAAPAGSPIRATTRRTAGWTSCSRRRSRRPTPCRQP